MHPEVMKRGIVLSADGVRRALPVRADPVHLQQVILNLALNGMDAMLNSVAGMRTMAVQTALVGRSEVELSVIDSGPGIPRDKLKGIFETFYTTKRTGTGLGPVDRPNHRRNLRWQDLGGERNRAAARSCVSPSRWQRLSPHEQRGTGHPRRR